MMYKQYKLDDWSKQAKISMIQNDLSVDDVCKKSGYSKPYIIAVINGKIRSDAARIKLSDVLGICSHYD